MSDLLIFKYDEINLDNIIYTQPLDASLASPNNYKKGYYIIYLTYNNNPLLIEIPSLHILDDYNNSRQEILLSLSAKDSKHDEKLHSFFSLLDKKFIKDVTKILKTNKFFNGINSMSYNAILKSLESNSLNGKCLIQLKLLDTTTLYDVNKKLINKHDYKLYLNNNSYLGTIIEISSIIFNNEQILINIKTHQMKVSYFMPKKIVLTEYSFIESNNESNSESNSECSTDNDITISVSDSDSISDRINDS